MSIIFKFYLCFIFLERNMGNIEKFVLDPDLFAFKARGLFTLALPRRYSLLILVLTGAWLGASVKMVICSAIVSLEASDLS